MPGASLPYDASSKDSQLGWERERRQEEDGEEGTDRAELLAPTWLAPEETDLKPVGEACCHCGNIDTVVGHAVPKRREESQGDAYPAAAPGGGEPRRSVAAATDHWTSCHCRRQTT
ncbi:MAG: hypothetical protein P8179_13200 [Candidatus Thiodiazotropha sp.]